MKFFSFEGEFPFFLRKCEKYGKFNNVAHSRGPTDQN